MKFVRSAKHWLRPVPLEPMPEQQTMMLPKIQVPQPDPHSDAINLKSVALQDIVREILGSRDIYRHYKEDPHCEQCKPGSYAWLL